MVLAEEGRFDAPTPPLTGPEALDLAAVADILTDLTGRPVRRVVAADDEWAAALTEHGMSADRVGILLGMFRAARRGEFATVGPELENLLQRPATPVRSILSAAVGRGSAGVRVR